MNVAICIDAEYSLPLFALLDSLRRNESSRVIRIFVIGAGLDSQLVKRIKRFGQGHLRSIQYIDADQSKIQHLPVQRWISRAAYLKLLAPRLLPPDAERVIMLDADVIVRSDLGPLWASEMENRLLLAVQDYGCPYVSDSFGIKHYRELGLAADAPYFNSGVMLIDLNHWSAEDVERRSIQYLESYASDLRCHDQEALNAVAADRWGMLDPRWNQMPHIYSIEHLPVSPYREQLLAQRGTMARDFHIVHFATWQKPWLPGCAHPARRLFLRHVRSSGYLSRVDYLRWRWRLARDAWRERTELCRDDGGTPPPSKTVTRPRPVSSAAANPAPRYRALGITALAVGQQRVWLHSARSGVSRIVTPGAAGLLFDCERFRTLDEHARRAAQANALRAMMSGNGARTGISGIAARLLVSQLEAAGAKAPVAREAVVAVRRQLEGFVRDGFLTADSALFARVAVPARPSVGTASETARVSVLGIPTRDRPKLLERALRSYAENLRDYGRDVQLVIMDDSRQHGSRNANRAAVMGAKKEFGIRFTIIDREWRERYAERIAVESGVPPRVVRFAVLGAARCGLSYGAARNALQLLSAGRMAIHVDDDTRCRQWRAVESREGSRMAVDHGGSQYWYLREASETCDAVEAINSDFIAVHEALLGATASELAGRIASGALAVEINDSSAAWLTNHDESAGIGVTLGGAVGDSGLRNPWPRLFSGGPSFDRLIDDEVGYRDRLTTRRVVRVATRATVTDSPLCIGMNLGLDHRRLLPPFMPVQRMEDGIFMTVLRRCMPRVGAGHLAYAVEHLPSDRADRYTLDFGRVGREYQVNDCLQWLIVSAQRSQWRNDPVLNLSSLGRFLEEVAVLPPREFEAELRLAGARMLGNQITAIERCLEERGGLPASWAQDAIRYIRSLQFVLTLPDFWVPTDLAGSTEERVRSLRELVHQYGALLRYWPGMHEAAGKTFLAEA